MRIVIKLIFLFLSISSKGQNRIVGEYRNYFGGHLEINADSTFHFRWHFDTQESWSRGIWKINNDTIYLEVILEFDTLRTENKKGIITDSLVLSKYGKKMTAIEILLSNDMFQNRVPQPGILYYKKRRLYLIKYGMLDKSRQNGLWTSKKFPTWFYKK